MDNFVRIDKSSFFETFFLRRIPGDQTVSQRRPLLLILPGGAYRHISLRESVPVAQKANAEGFHAVVLHYSVLEETLDISLEDLLGQVKFTLDWILEHADDIGIDSEQISLIGFSAGGHLAAWSAIRFSEQIYKQVLAYGAIAYKKEEMELIRQKLLEGSPAGTFGRDELLQGEKMIELMGDAPIEALTAAVPPCFLFSAMDDQIVPVTQSFDYARRLLELNVPCELHFYERGGHGLSLANAQSAKTKAMIIPHVATWFDLALEWLRS